MKNLCKWLNIKEPYSDDKVYPYFVTFWSGYKKPKTRWMTDVEFSTLDKTKTHLIKFSEFTFRRRKIEIWGSEELSEYEYEFGRDQKYIYSPFLISLIQKTIRRQMGNFSVVVAKHLLKQNFEKLVRRLTIIMVEDVEYYHEPFKTICWLIYSKKTEWPIFVFEWILGTIDLLCISSDFKNSYSGKTLSKGKNSKISNRFQQTVQVRRSWGSMKSDDIMLGKLLTERNRNVKKSMKKTRYIDIRTIQSLDLNLILNYGLFAIDHHCSNIIDLVINNFKYIKYKEEELKYLIWTYRSSINTRQRSNYKDDERYQQFLKIYPIVEKCSIEILMSKKF